jgi:hypothetical protein
VLDEEVEEVDVGNEVVVCGNVVVVGDEAPRPLDEV